MAKDSNIMSPRTNRREGGLHRLPSVFYVTNSTLKLTILNKNFSEGNTDLFFVFFNLSTNKETREKKIYAEKELCRQQMLCSTHHPSLPTVDFGTPVPRGSNDWPSPA